MPETSSQRIAKRIAQAGLCSRREAERWIEAGRVTVNNKKITTPACTVTDEDIVAVDGEVVAGKEQPRMWIYHKPTGLLTTHDDPEGRPTVFSSLPAQLPRVISVGRLDINSEGLLLLTNDGELARQMELPSSGYKRSYRVRVRGRVTERVLNIIRKGVHADGVKYAPAEVQIDSSTGNNHWLTMTLTEGKNREIRNIFAHFDCQVSRLIRIAYGPYQLGKLPKGQVMEVDVGRIKTNKRKNN